jgi:hypothetical protein
MGPWSHGDWARNSTKQVIGNNNLETVFPVIIKKNIETNFTFRHFLK